VNILTTYVKSLNTSDLDGGWSNWSEWDNCTAECDGGNQTRVRSCTNPIPQFNGTDCGDDDHETQVCNEEPCPIGNVIVCRTNSSIISIICILYKERTFYSLH